MLGVVDDVLTIAQLEAGQFELALERVDLVKAAEKAVARFRQTEAGSKHDIAVAASGASCPVSADRRAVKQMLQKLLSNAAKFSPSGTAIHVTIDADSGRGWTRLRVADRGIGMTSDTAELVVRPFRQADSRLARKYGGTGLGLSIVNALIDRHGGRLTIDTAPRVGTCVSLDFRSVREDARPWREMTEKPQTTELLAS
jgi:signal transduction histidine kinase